MPWSRTALTFTGVSPADRKSTRLNSSHGYISYAVFCLKKKNVRAGSTLHSGLAAHHVARERRIRQPPPGAADPRPPHRLRERNGEHVTSHDAGARGSQS